MDDLISRQAAIDAVCMEWCNVKHQDCKHPFDFEKYGCYWCEGCETALRTLPNLPSAQPERKKGKWIDRGNYCVCNQCWHTEQQFNGVEPIPRHTPFCAICGADMREKEKNDE